MAIAWTPDLSVGVERIDDQHKIWFEKANELFKAGKERRANDYINTMIDFLDENTKKHFKDMRKSIWKKSATLSSMPKRKHMQVSSRILLN